MDLNNLSIKTLAFLQATGLLAYISLIALFFKFANRIFGNGENFSIPILMLTLFVFSALVCSSIVLGRFVYLFWEKRYREAFTLLAWTAGWIFIYLIIVAMIVAVRR